MVGKTKKPTKEEQRRFQAIQSIGCLPCRMEGLFNVPCEIHHVVEGAYRRGHSYTYGVCPYHHRGLTPEGLIEDTAYKIAGPSMALNKKQYQERYGTEQELLWEQERLIKMWESSFV